MAQIDRLYEMIYWTDTAGVMVSKLNDKHVQMLLSFNDTISNLNGWMLFMHKQQV